CRALCHRRIASAGWPGNRNVALGQRRVPSSRRRIVKHTARERTDPFLAEVCRHRQREGRFDYLLVGSTGVSAPLPAAETRLGRRTALTFPLLPPPQKN